MSRLWQTILIVVVLAAAGAIAFLPGIGWGLPSRAADGFLFGGRRPWTGQEILALAGNRPDDPNLGADVDINPLAKGNKPIPLNGTDAQRAAIARRYRLSTSQPDEMITLMALAKMRPSQGRFDPQLYQYGGLWIYPVAGLIKAASEAGLVNLTTDLAWYLDHPEAFGRLYVVARLYCVAWALVGVWAVLAITRKLTGGCLASAAVAALCVIVMPVVVNMAHEAKPHLPGAVLMLLAVLAAMRYVETGRSSWWLGTAALCGAAFGMVLSSWPIFVVLPAMLVVRRVSWQEVFSRTVFGGMVGLAVYLLTNPYVPINLAANRAVLRSNFGNSLAMYEIARLGEGCVNAAWLVVEGTSPILAVFGAGGAAWLLIRGLCGPRADGGGAGRVRGLGWLLAAPAALILLQFAALAAGKPVEYGRFAVLPDIALAIAAVTAVRRRLATAAHGIIPAALLLLTTASSGSEYLLGFIRDASASTSRAQAACQLLTYSRSGARALGVVAEPAPYDLPPVDLFEWQILLLPANATAEMIDRCDVLVRPWGTRPFATAAAMDNYRPDPPVLLELDPKPIGWADKRFDIQVRKRSQQP